MAQQDAAETNTEVACRGGDAFMPPMCRRTLTSEVALRWFVTMKRLKTKLWIVWVMMLAAGCAKTSLQSRPLEPTAAVANTVPIATSVSVHGALREIMHMGRTERRADLGSLVGQTGLYGLGALEGLAGEVTLWDGQLWLSTPDGHGGAVAGHHKTTTAGATLLVTSVVTAWQQRPITQAVSFAQLDAFIEREARAAGLNVEEAFAFRIEGTPTRLDWHVIDGSKIPSGVHGHEAHMKTAVRGSLAGKPVRILGFYSPKHHAIFTHHDTNSHAHVISVAPMITGHIDHVDISGGCQLFLPTR
jgi:acetolactate decarboxylase